MTHNVCMFCENTAPMVKTAARGVVTAYTMYVHMFWRAEQQSEVQNLYRDWGKSATVELVLSFSWTMR